MGGIDHVDVVGTIANREGNDVLVIWVIPHEHHDLSLLLGGDPAGQDNAGIFRKFQKLGRDFLFALLGYPFKLFTSNDNCFDTGQPNHLCFLVKILDLFVDVIGTFSIDDEYLHVVVQELAAETDVDGGLNFVTGQHPELYSCLPDEADRICNFYLKLVFDGRATNQEEVLLD